MDIKSCFLKSTFFVILIFAGLFFVSQSARADSTTPFLGINNQYGDISEARGFIVALSDDVENCKVFRVIVRTDKMELVMINAQADKGVVKESMVGREVFVKAKVALRVEKQDTEPYIQLQILSVRPLKEKTSNDINTNKEPESIDEEALALEEARKWKDKRPQSNQITDFVKLEMRFGISYRLIKGMVSKDQLPLLYKLLEDEQYAPYWPNIARVIGLASNEPDTVSVLLKYLQRDDGKRVNDLQGKIWSLAYIGKIGGKEADSILKKAITKEGAKELTKSWLDDQLWKDDFKSYDKEEVIIEVQKAALHGLVFTGKPENWKIVEDLYNRNKEISMKNGEKTDIISSLVSVMGARDFIIDHNNNPEAYFRIEHDNAPGTLMSYTQKYLVRPK